MLPVLQIGPAAVPTYPLLLLVAFWAGMWVAARRARQLGLESDHVYNAGLYGLLAGVLGARLWFVLSHWENYAGDLSQAFSLSRNALSPSEGLMIAGLAVFIYLQRQRLPLGLFFDALAPGLALALIIGHIGAFLGGEGLGAPSTMPWAIEVADMTRHPVQLYEALAGLVILAVLFWGRRWRPWPGFQFWLVVGLYSLARLLLEIFWDRPYLVGGYLAGQIVALATLVVTLAVMAYNFNVKRETRNERRET
jgi:phosphatidylglycerol:prolipoprotein diacylglycerol transferase